MGRDEFDLTLSAYATRRLAEESPGVSFPWVARLLADVVERARDLAYPEGELTLDEWREAYVVWRVGGQAMHAVLLRIWKSVTPDSEYASFGQDPEAVWDAVRPHLHTRVTDEMVAAFKRAWHEADAAGLEGGRVRAALEAALGVTP